MTPITVPRRPRRTCASARIRLTTLSAVAASAAALALAACGPHDDSVAQPFAGGTLGTTTTTTTTTVATTSTPATPTAPAAVPAAPPAPTTLPAATQPAPAYATVPPVVVARNDAGDMPVRNGGTYAADPAYAPAERPAAPVQQRAAVAQNRIGSVEHIEAIRSRPQGSGAGAVVGGVLGGVIGNRFGSGTGRAAMTGLGAVGGAIAGNNVERNYKTSVVGYRVEVRLDNGSTRSFQRSQIGNLHVGDRVRLDNQSFHRV